MKSGACENCYFYETKDGRGNPLPANQCHRFPPVPVDATGKSVWPNVQPTDRCGEYKQ